MSSDLDFVAAFTGSATFVLLGVVGLIYWCREHRLRRLCAEHRAFVMVQEAKREVRRHG